MAELSLRQPHPNRRQCPAAIRKPSHLISSSTQARIPELAAAFQRRDPFRHVVIDDFLDRSAADRLLAEFPDFDTKRALNEMGEIGNKAVVEQIRALGPSYAALDDLIQTPAFLALMSQITGIPDFSVRYRETGPDVYDAVLAEVKACAFLQDPAWERELAPGKPVRIAVNQDMADADTPVKTGDEVAYFPPVTGG